MAITKDKKKDILIQNFEILKDDYLDNKYGISKIVSQMFGLDTEIAINMWEYLLIKHEKEVQDDDSYWLTGSIIHDGEKKIGENKMYDIILKNQKIKKALFSYTCDDIQTCIGDIIARKVETRAYKTTDELLQMVYDNQYKNSTWYEIMDAIMDYLEDRVDKITETNYELLEEWCNKVENKKERAKLSVRLLEFID